MESALAGSDGNTALRITASLGVSWLAMGQADARAWLVRALEGAPNAPDILRGWALMSLALHDMGAIEPLQATAHLRVALELFRQSGHRSGESLALWTMGRIAEWVHVDARPAASWFEDALQVAREINAPECVSSALTLLAGSAYWRGDLDSATGLASEALDIAVTAGIPYVAPMVLCLQALMTAERGEDAEADRLLDEAVEAASDAGDRTMLTSALQLRAFLEIHRSNPTAALDPLCSALRVARDSGLREIMFPAVVIAVHTLWHRGRAQDAATILGAAEAVMEPLPPPLAGDENFPRRVFAWAAALPSAGLESQRSAGRRLSLEQASALALLSVEEELARLEVASSSDVALPRERPMPAPATLRREGDYWTLSHGGATARLRDMKGLHYIAYLLGNPGCDVHVLDLVHAVTPMRDTPSEPAPPRGGAGPVLDAQAKAAYRSRLGELREELAAAEQFHDEGRAARARYETEALTEQLAAAVGLGGRDRVAAMDAERARSAVTHGIKGALRRIREGLPTLADELELRIGTGTYCLYTPDPVHPVDWDV